jgi:Family of unknown function (DUF5691)
LRDPIIAIALAGTSRQERVNLTTGTPVDTLLNQLSEGEVERAFLLGAGAWAVYRQAGTQTQHIDQANTPAADETLRECSPEMALLLSQFLSGTNDELLPEALEHLRLNQLRLPFRLLPQVLSVTNKETRATLAPLLGERGRWLSQFNASWQWVQNYLVSETDGLPGNAEEIWQEGTSGARVEILRRLCTVDGDKARQWLEAVWKQEKAETRNDLLNVLEINLRAADEPFLEKALDDRATSVRATAAILLARLPASAFCERMRQRARQMLSMVDGHIVVEPPTAFAGDWQRDGLVEKHPSHLSPRAWWLTQILAVLEPTFWETHLSAPPETLLNLFAPDDTWQTQVIEGWSKAARTFRTLNWLQPLWSWWYAHYQSVIEKQQLTEYSYREQLLQCMPGPQAERVLLSLIEQGEDGQSIRWSDLLSQLPRPWSVEFAQTYLRLFREQSTVEKLQVETFNAYSDPWLQHLSAVALALPVASFTEALRPWDFPEDANWHIQHARQKIQTFSTLVHMRQQIHAQTSDGQ